MDEKTVAKGILSLFVIAYLLVIMMFRVPLDTAFYILGLLFSLLIIFPLIYLAASLKVSSAIYGREGGPIAKQTVLLWVSQLVAFIAFFVVAFTMSKFINSGYGAGFDLVIGILLVLSFICYFFMFKHFGLPNKIAAGAGFFSLIIGTSTTLYSILSVTGFSYFSSSLIYFPVGIIILLAMLYESKAKKTENLSAKVAVIIMACILIFSLVAIFDILGRDRYSGHGGGGRICVSSPINEMITKIQRAQSGIVTSTDSICMNAGEAFTSEALTSKITNLASLTFRCDGAAICNTRVIDVSSGGELEATGDAQFKALIDCEKRSNGDYDCTITIKNA